jgi:phosphoesterase RecJ-like protein
MERGEQMPKVNKRKKKKSTYYPDMCFGLLILLIVSFFFHGLSVVLNFSVSVLSAIIFDYAGCKIIKAKFKVKMDHHPDVEDYAKVKVVRHELAAASELVCNMIFNLKGDYKLSKEAAHYFYIALVGDSGRFQYSSTTPHTFAIAQELLKTGIDISSIYHNMYEKNIDDLNVTAHILNNFHVSPYGVAYYVLPLDIQEKLKITTERGKENVNLFANIKGINAWCSITEDSKEPCWRVSIRSKSVPINGVAAMFEGGGHDQASGAKLRSLDDLPRFIEALDNLFK